MPVTRRVARLKQGAAARSSCPLSHDPGRRPRAFISPFRSRFESSLGVLPSLLAHLVWAIWTPLGNVFKASLRVQRTSPPVCVPDSSACASPVPQPFQSNHSSEHCTPGLGFGCGGAGSAPEPPRRCQAYRADLRLRDQCPAGRRPPAQRLQRLLFHLESAWPGGARGRGHRAHLRASRGTEGSGNAHGC